MNELFADFTYESDEFDNAVAKAAEKFIEATCSYIERFETEHLITENEKDSLVTSIKKFFANLIAAMKNFVSEIQVEVSRKVRESTTDSKLHKLYKDLKKAKENGATKVNVMDVWTIEKEYIKATNELKEIALKFSKMKYKRVSEIDDDIVKFNKIYDKWDKELAIVAEKKITVDIDKMINFVEDELSNRSKIMDTINDSMALLEQMEKDCELMETKSDILGPDIIPKHFTLIRKISMGITKFIKKWAVKIISTVVFIIG